MDSILTSSQEMVVSSKIPSQCCACDPSRCLPSWAGVTRCESWEEASWMLLGSTPVEENRLRYRKRLNFHYPWEALVLRWPLRSELEIKGPVLHSSQNNNSWDEGCPRRVMTWGDSSSKMAEGCQPSAIFWGITSKIALREEILLLKRNHSIHQIQSTWLLNHRKNMLQLLCLLSCYSKETEAQKG